ncbi:acyloxyacyl hydrolase [Marinilabilia sp.]|uniref:acyloxyacyl hydrolase n=1 Tax=Marinilabilia sp. TaxID=2021252 RepID=UPI0025B8A23C|nr:acyloxyacyl hydrolase [Marinilabilia sp.]
MKFLKSCLVFLFLSLVSYGQATEERNSVRFMTGYVQGGKLQIHSSKIDHFRGVQPYGAGLDFSWKFVSSNAYALCRCYPSMGISLNYWNFGAAALGNGVSALFYVEPVLFSFFGTDVAIRSGLGVTYLDNPHDELRNPDNIVYSTSIAFPLMAGISLDYPVSEKWSLRLVANFQHISNGGTNQPNLGLNYTTLGMGVARKLDLQDLPPPPEIDSYDASKNEKGIALRFIAGLKEPEESESKAAVLGLTAEYYSQFARINGWSAGMMGEWDSSRAGSSLTHNGRLSAIAGHHFLLGRFDFGQTAGLYLMRGHSTHSLWFQYYTLDFGLNQLIHVGVGLKAHGKVAEFLGVRLSVFL